MQLPFYAVPFYCAYAPNNSRAVVPYRLQYLHYRPLYHTVTVWQLVYFAAFRFVLDKHAVFASSVGMFQQLLPYLVNVSLQISSKTLHLLAVALPF